MLSGNSSDRSFKLFEDKSKVFNDFNSWKALRSMFPKTFDETFKYCLQMKKKKMNKNLNEFYANCDGCQATYSDGYERNVLLVITVILLRNKLKFFKCKYLY